MTPTDRIITCQERARWCHERSILGASEVSRTLWQEVAAGWYAAARYHHGALTGDFGDPVHDPPVYCGDPHGIAPPRRPRKVSPGDFGTRIWPPPEGRT